MYSSSSSQGNDFQSSSSSFLSWLTNHVEAWPFLEPVDPVALQIPEYFDVIRHPMDLSTIRTRLGSYSGWTELQSDLDLMLDNAIVFNNAPNHPIAQIARRLRISIIARLSTIMPPRPASPPKTKKRMVRWEPSTPSKKTPYKAYPGLLKKPRPSNRPVHEASYCECIGFCDPSTCPCALDGIGENRAFSMTSQA